MTTKPSAGKIAAPLKNGNALLSPAYPEFALNWSENQRLLNQNDVKLAGQSLVQFREMAQTELIEIATKQTREYRDVNLSNRQPSILMSGHQPELFHPGVWYKNFVLSRFAEQLQATPININIDTELHQKNTISIPDTTGDTLRDIPLIQNDRKQPYEYLTVKDAPFFDAFAKRVQHQTDQLKINSPIITSLEKHLRQRSTQTDLLGNRIASARHRLEADHGLNTLEVRLSDIARTRSFAQFASAILCDLPRFVASYHNALVQYRRINRLRSKSHPAPDLHFTETQHETPFWIYDSHSQRQPLIVDTSKAEFRCVNSEFTLKSCKLNLDEVADLIYETNQTDIAIRPRALITTMYARTILSDSFIHGIGGSKYDSATDDIIREWLGIEPPDFITATATIELPVAKPDVSKEQAAELESQLKDAKFHPERLIDQPNAPDQINAMIAEKNEWVRKKIAKGQGKERHHRIGELNAMLRAHIADKVETMAGNYAQIQAKLQRKKMLQSREFSFCLFPEDDLTSKLKSLAANGKVTDSI